MRTSWKPIVDRSKALRRAMTLPEVLLWRILRTRPGGHKFRRQHAAGPYVLDFYCVETALCIEVDGKAHDMGRNPQRDEQRDRWLAEQGIKTIRIPAEEILRDPEPVLTFIAEECASRSAPKSSPAFAGEGDQPKAGGGATCSEERPSTGFAGPPPLEIEGRT